MSISTTLGYPRIGKKRELKFALEKYWKEKISQEELIQIANHLKSENYQEQKDAGIELIPFNDFAYYDHILTHTQLIGALPEQYSKLNHSNKLDQYFAAARGTQKNADLPAMEMTKWFNTNYHYIVPQLKKGQTFALTDYEIFQEFAEQKKNGYNLKPVIIGPVSYLLLAKSNDCSPLELIDNILPVYKEILENFKKVGASIVQIDEPFLVMDLQEATQQAFTKAYNYLKDVDIKIFLATYFDTIGDNIDLTLSLPIDTLHIDLSSAPQQLNEILEKIPQTLNLSLGLVNGRNIWNNDLENSLSLIQKTLDKIDTNRIYISSSCSLLHSPYNLEFEQHIENELKIGLSFAKQKLQEITTLSKATTLGPQTIAPELELNNSNKNIRANSHLINNKSTQDRINNFSEKHAKRQSEYKIRREIQQQELNLPKFPTTTIGSFPQTSEVRKARLQHKKQQLSEQEYNKFLQDETANAIKIQEELNIDVLVHGEFERNDMVEYFGEQIEGMAFSQFGWVQSYGSRCVKPPIIFGDINRPQPITVNWTKYAQSLSSKPVKGMLTGPITMLKWSFVREDQPLETTCLQMAYAIRDEVNDLANAGIKIIQIDEPAIREGLPLRKNDQENYIDWAIKCYRVSSCGVDDKTQIHSHMCYSEFNDIMPAIIAMDSDVVSIEASRSQLDIMEIFAQHKYPAGIGLGVYDIHSPRIPTAQEMSLVLNAARKYLSDEQIWVNPDCGLKTRQWEEVKPALKNMVEVTQNVRASRT